MDLDRGVLDHYRRLAVEPGRELTGEAAELRRQMNEFLDFCQRIADA